MNEAKLSPELKPGAVHVWQASLDLPEARVGLCAALLSQRERERAERFLFDHLRRRYTAGHAALRILLGRYLRTEPAAVSFAYSDRGKPRLAPAHDPCDIAFNMSDSGTVGLFAFVRGGDVGVDVEALRPLHDLSGMMRQVCTPGELERLNGLPEDARRNAFFQMWAIKEAALKATGEGIAGLQRVESILGMEGTRPAYGVRSLAEGENARWVLHRLESIPGCAAAVVLPQGDWRLETFRLEEEAFPLPG